MGEHLVLCIDRLITPQSLQSLQDSEAAGYSGEKSCSLTVDPSTSIIDVKEEEGYDVAGEDEPLLQTLECRICQEEDSIKNLEAPCACSGSLKFAHRKCVQRWCNEKGDTTCEICHQPYQSGYTAPPPNPEDTTIDISGGWTIADGPLDLHDPRLLAMAVAERHLIEAEYDDYADSSASGAAFCRSAALILMALLLLRHALTIGTGDGNDDDVSTFFSLFLLRVAGFLLPCYIMAWAISVLQHRRQRQEAAEAAAEAAAAAAALSATEVAFMLQAAQQRAFQATIVPGPAQAAAPAATQVQAVTPHPEQVQ